ncbi:hypothetical protein JTE90_022235 [Oedothorax gibbosus]|uniref:Uncharacterized protein n=1 Tax=Oedothorax gibbosus TaxID=931172 RepID=A0AAV6VXZ5_9ARAC|nr:hypothetical protein JTE90_022235 [Oedothorax gibbosus]
MPRSLKRGTCTGTGMAFLTDTWGDRTTATVELKHLLTAFLPIRRSPRAESEDLHNATGKPRFSRTDTFKLLQDTVKLKHLVTAIKLPSHQKPKSRERRIFITHPLKYGANPEQDKTDRCCVKLFS